MSKDNRLSEFSDIEVSALQALLRFYRNSEDYGCLFDPDEDDWVFDCEDNESHISLLDLYQEVSNETQSREVTDE
jgi:hypothetical protein